MINKINEWIAIHLTLIFGTMWTTYAFFLYGFLPIAFPSHQTNFLYWSSSVQLWSLPLIIVGQNLLNRAAEKRNEEMYNMVQTEFNELKIIIDSLLKLQNCVDTVEKEIEKIEEIELEEHHHQ